MIRICKRCGIEFNPHGSQKFCNKEKYLPCKICGKEILCKCSGKEPFCRSKKCQGETVRRSFQRRFGVDNPSQLKSVQEIKKKKALERYGVDHFMKDPLMKERYYQGLRDKFGVDNIYQLDSVKDKIKETNLKNLGVEYPTQSKEVIKKSQETFRKNYGVNNIYQLHISNFDEWENLENYLKENSKTFFELVDYFNVSPAILGRKLKENDWFKYLKSFQYKYSIPELEIKAILDDLGFKEFVDYIPRTRKIITPYELDFYLPELNIAIEVNPKFTHSITNPFDNDREGRDKTYHYNKWKMSAELGIDLISVFDWTDLDYVKDRLQNKIEITNLEIKNELGLHNYMLSQGFKIKEEIEPELINEVYDCGSTLYEKCSFT